jgi:hypothetical protein
VTTRKKKYTEDEEAYLKKLMSHGMDRTRAEWYLNAMQTWTHEDYDKYNAYHIWMLGGFDDDETLGKAKTDKEFFSLYKKLRKKAP